MCAEKFRYNYVIGDVQGCYAALMDLLKKIKFDPSKDCVWFAGDLVARGEDSLSTLRLIKKMNDHGAAQVVLGNHDLNLIAVWRGFRKVRDADGTRPILEAKDASELLNWLRKQPLLQRPSANTVMTHAGIPRNWTVKEAEGYAKEVESVLAASHAALDDFLEHMFGALPDTWHDDLSPPARLRLIVNYFTRMRLTSASGGLEFTFQDGLDKPMPDGYAPWFMWPRKNPNDPQMLFGHWASLNAESNDPMICPLDGGCVWGGKLIAYRLEDEKTFFTQVGCGE